MLTHGTIIHPKYIVMRSVLYLIGVILLVICLAPFFNALHDARTGDYEQTFAEITTGVGVTSSNVTLAQDIWADSIASVTSITSNITGENPSAAAFNSTSRTLTIGGLGSNDIRDLLVGYEIENPSLEGFSGVSVFLVVVAWVIVLSILGLVARAIYELIF